MATYSIFWLLAYFSPKSRGKRKSAMFSTKKIWKVTIFWLGMENGFWFEKTRLHLIANLPALCCVISVSDSSVHFVAEFLHCSVKSGLTLALGHPIERPTAEDWAYTSRGALYDCVSWFKTIFFSTALIIKWSRGGARDVDSPIRRYWRYAFKTISCNYFSYKSLVTLSGV